jgi:hypothetical protein
MAMVGLAVDAGRGYVDRRALQSGADTAVEVGTMLLAYNAHQPTVPYTDTNIKDQIANAVNNSLSLGSGLSKYLGSDALCATTSTTAPTNVPRTCAWYADKNGNLVLSGGNAVQVGAGTMPPVCPVFSGICTAGVAVVPYYTHNTGFLQVVGSTVAAERSTATAVYAPVTTTSAAGVADYAVAACLNTANPPRAPQPGDQVIIQDQNWANTYSGCGVVGSVGSADFKGWYHSPIVTTQTAGKVGSFVTLFAGTSIPNPEPAGGCTFASGNCGINSPGNPPTVFITGGTKTTFTELDYFGASGGHSFGGQQADPNAIPLIHSSWLSCHGGQPPCHPLLIPVIDYFNGVGMNLMFHVAYFVAAVPDQDWKNAAQDPWTATIVSNGIVQHRGDWSGCTSNPCPPVGPNTPFSIGLVH